MKTLDQIWNENFEFLPPGDLTGYTGSCGNGLGGSAEDNQKVPLDTVADKINSIRNGPDGDPLSDAAKEAKIQRIKDDANKRGKLGDGKGPIREGLDPCAPLIYPDGHTGANPPRKPSYDPNDPANSKGGPPINGIPNYSTTDPDAGGVRAVLTYDKDLNPVFYGEFIKPDPLALLKTGLTAGAIALREACASNKPNPNVKDPPNADPKSKPQPPTRTTPLVADPNSKPPITYKPFRITPPSVERPPANTYGQRPVVPTTCWVAREVYGADNPKWLQFREWMLTEASDILRNYYIEYGERIAEWIRNKPRIKAIIRKWMDSKIKSI